MLHPLDALVVGVAVVVVSAAALGYVMLRRSHPVNLRVEPPTIRAFERTRLHVRGAGLVPFLTVFVVPAGERFALNLKERNSSPAEFYFASATDAEIRCPDLAPGSYDVYFYDQGRQVAYLPHALSVAFGRDAERTLDVLVRFFVAPETAPLIRVGDRDARRPAAPSAPSEAAVVRALAREPRTAETYDLRRTADELRFTGTRASSAVIDATLSVPAARRQSEPWRYRDAAVRAGEWMTFATERYVARGVVLRAQ